jgi:hypothetical protein
MRDHIRSFPDLAVAGLMVEGMGAVVGWEAQW